MSVPQILALQRTAGNAAVARMLSARIDRSQETCEPEPDVAGSCTPAIDSPGDVVSTLLFDSGSASLNEQQRAEIDAVAETWRSMGGESAIRVDGYASTDGPEDVNWELSCRRAQAVAAAFSESAEIDASMIDTVAHGESDEEQRAATISIGDAVVVDPPTAPDVVEPKPAPAAATAEELIERYTDVYPRLTPFGQDIKLVRHEALGAELRRGMPANAALVVEVLDLLRSGDRDDLSLALLKDAGDEEITAWESDPGGRRVLVRALGELATGFNPEVLGWEDVEQEQRVMALLTGETIPEEDADGGVPTAERPEDIVAKYADSELALAYALLDRLQDGQGQLVDRVFDALESGDRKAVTRFMLMEAGDAQLQAIASDPAGRAFLLRLVREMDASLTVGHQRSELRRLMEIITAADRDHAGAKPVEVEVLTFLTGDGDWGGLGVLRGHTAIAIGGLIYSYEAGFEAWSCGRTRDEYLRAKSGEHHGVGQVLRVPQEDAHLIQDRLNRACSGGAYLISGDICSDAAAGVLEEVLTGLGAPGWSTGALVRALDATGKVAAHRFYPMTGKPD
jgi:outer membrane protein OmpA-like peptidoglycan-associated protein